MTLHRSITEVSSADWNRLAAARLPDLSHEYLAFREQREPGAPVVAALRDACGLTGAVHGTRATAASGLFSHPWKMLTGDQFRRDSGDDSRREHERLIEGAGAARAALADALVVRAYDTSDLLLSGDAPENERARTALALLDALRDGEASAVVFPFVRPQDELLRTALAERGFHSGCLTAASTVDTGGAADYAAFLASLPSQVRRHYAKAERELPGGVTVTEVPLLPNLDRIADLETQTLAKNGGPADFEAVRAARRRQAELMPGQLRVAGAVRDGEILACAVQLIGPGGCCVLAYGCDYTAGEGSIAYHHLMFNEPVARCVAQGVAAYRLGFEAFQPKRQRGARVERREMWLWLPDTAAMAGAARLLDFLTGLNSDHLGTFGATA
ncbi:hypothetical protein L3Q67_32560 [Saccharothrix sp. AJ9571]|nr:hypothetical protein L3Q67_32560 [Saccharothrix sp. AJ9571]